MQTATFKNICLGERRDDYEKPDKSVAVWCSRARHVGLTDGLCPMRGGHACPTQPDPAFCG